MFYGFTFTFFISKLFWGEISSENIIFIKFYEGKFIFWSSGFISGECVRSKLLQEKNVCFLPKRGYKKNQNLSKSSVCVCEKKYGPIPTLKYLCGWVGLTEMFSDTYDERFRCVGK